MIFFGGFQRSRPPGAGVAPCPIMGAENLNFLNLLKTMIVGALWFRLGLLSIRILYFLKSDKNDGVMAPKAGRENAHDE